MRTDANPGLSGVVYHYLALPYIPPQDKTFKEHPDMLLSEISCRSDPITTKMILKSIEAFDKLPGIKVGVFSYYIRQIVLSHLILPTRSMTGNYKPAWLVRVHPGYSDLAAAIPVMCIGGVLAAKIGDSTVTTSERGLYLIRSALRSPSLLLCGPRSAPRYAATVSLTLGSTLVPVVMVYMTVEFPAARGIFSLCSGAEWETTTYLCTDLDFRLKEL
ncbi:uncharacterized protein MYCFIDRAFT_170087 [Pseudocercospora fijiensis CIRAD86]|uniref:Uncharacterized protein n=1 Tax=Pseudocercospora fijiensis (strain CIRAD86) TaxID=383855 RepID=N1Q783_PSEFD|nr:uncharacterized protein MYCFIDRAFT_170087 [Pseudocercospora fijiensis CIRAD86]EME88475.1 hypothetical protein MYCFIDRAFT_170087 [Pseudocercospora fijiensis CIRAD86]